MEKIEINLVMGDNGDINISNKADDKSITIDSNLKELNAKKIYDLLNYTTNKQYEILTNIDNVDNKFKEYFNEVIELFNKIIYEINNIKEN